ncbi:permease [Deltaproteobacteria bacterium TL4]
MFQVFTQLATWLVEDIMKISLQSRLGQSLHFFIEDTTKILVLLVIMIYGIALLRASMNTERIRDYLQRKGRWSGYVLAALFGSVTPFCSCSSIPLFMGFTTARIPIGITMAFLITSPMINEVAVVMLGSMLGWTFMLVYIAAGLTVGIVGGLVMDLLKTERFLLPFLRQAIPQDNLPDNALTAVKLSFQERHAFALTEMKEIFSRVWKWVIIGVGVGAGLHGLVPEVWITDTLGAGQWWSVPLAVLVGIPLYSNATGIIPVMQTLLAKGLPVGTTLAFSMSTIAASIPEFMLLKQVMEWKLLGILFGVLLVAFTLVGWFFNYFWGIL